MYLFYLLLFAISYAKVSVTSVGDLHIAEPLKNHSIPLFISDDPSMTYLVKLNSWINNANQLHLYRKRRSISLSRAINISVTSVDDELFYKAELETPWHSQLLSVPQVVLFLGQLLIASSTRDFSFQDDSLNVRYRYLRYPSSSHATMLQIANETWHAFEQAHHNMDLVQLSMQQIPYFIKDALKILEGGSQNRIKIFLPKVLKNIELKSQEAMKAATETHLAIANLMLLIGEVVEASGLTKTTSEKKLKETEKALAVARKMLEELTKMKEFVQKEFQEVRSKMKHALKEYSSASKKVQTAKKQVAQQQFIRGIFNFVVDTFTTGLRVLLLGPTFGFLSAALSERRDQTSNNDHSPVANAKFLATMALERVRDSVGRYDQRYEDFKQAQAQCSQLMVHIAKLDFTIADRQQIINVLHDVIGILGNLREQWSKLMQFFGHLETLITHQLPNTKTFIEDVRETMKNSSFSQTDAQLMKVLLKSQTTTIDQSTHLVFIMSRSYVDISRQYVVEQVAGLPKFLVATTNEERNRLKDELLRTAQNAQNHITSLVEERKRQYHQVMDHKRKELNEFLKDLGGMMNASQALKESDQRVEGLPIN